LILMKQKGLYKNFENNNKFSSSKTDTK